MKSKFVGADRDRAERLAAKKESAGHDTLILSESGTEQGQLSPSFQGYRVYWWFRDRSSFGSSQDLRSRLAASYPVGMDELRDRSVIVPLTDYEWQTLFPGDVSTQAEMKSVARSVLLRGLDVQGAAERTGMTVEGIQEAFRALREAMKRGRFLNGLPFNESVRVEAMDMWESVYGEISLHHPELSETQRVELAEQIVERVFRDHGGEDDY